MTNIELIEEIITKQCERYALEDSGFVSDRLAVVKELSCCAHAHLSASATLNEFARWKDRLLNDWYSRKGFSGFFRRKAEKPCMFGMVRRLVQHRLSVMRRQHTEATIDDELRVDKGRTVAFKLSLQLFKKFYRETCCSDALFASPGQLEQNCMDGMNSLFPLKYASFYERLSAKDDEFWQEIWRLVHRFVRFLVLDKHNEDEEAVKEVCMETVISVHEQLERGRLAQIMSARHLLNSLQMTGRNKFHEWLRAEGKRSQEVLLEDEDWQGLEFRDTASPGYERLDGRFDYLLEVNDKSEYDVCCALVHVLTYGHGKVYQELVGGMEDVVQSISMRYVENKSYEEIATVLYGASGGRKLESMRKSVSRGKEYLKKRMANMIVEYKRKGCVPFEAEEEIR